MTFNKKIRIMEEQKKVCEMCGGDVVWYSKSAIYDLNTHKYLGLCKWQDENDFYYCDDCKEETEPMMGNEWKAINRDTQIDEIIND